MSFKENFLSLFYRYYVLILLGFAIPIFYKIFLPLTIYPVYFILSFFIENITIQGNTILSTTLPKIQIINSCIAVSAYYLLVFLNLSTKDIQKRIKILFTSVISLLILNILRILFLIFILAKTPSYFVLTHEIFWYAISTLFVVLIWFAHVKIYKIKSIPIYSDLKYIYNLK